MSLGIRWAEAADNALLSAAVSGVCPSPSPSPSHGGHAPHLPPDYDETMERVRTRGSLRREPVGATSEPTQQPPALSDGDASSSSSSSARLSVSASAPAAPAHPILVVLPNEGGPLGQSLDFCIYFIFYIFF